jgi:hypothetical protein
MADYKPSMLPLAPRHDTVSIERIQRTINQQTPNVWYNYNFPITDYIDHLYYPIIDTREVTLARRTTEQYLANGAEAEATGEVTYGVKARNALILRTIGLRYESIVYDLLHKILNENKHQMEFFKGKRGVSEADRKQCVANGTHPNLRFIDSVHAWKMTDKDFRNIDVITNCLLIPTGYKDKFNLLFPMKHTGHMRAKDHQVFAMVYAPYLYTFTGIHKAYRSYTARYASDLSRLLSPCITVEELHAIILSVFETRGIKEGLFPESMQFFSSHQMVEIVNHVFRLGHVKGLMCYFGERALGIIKRCCTTSGVNYLKAVYYNYLALENALCAENSNTPVDFFYLDNSGVFSDFVLKLYGSSESFRLPSDHIKNDLWKCLVDFLMSQEIDALSSKSCFMRIYLVYEHNKDRLFSESDVNGFAGWIDKLHGAYIKLGSVNEARLVQATRAWIDGITGETEGMVQLTDFRGIIRDIATFCPTIYLHAIVKGLTFRARGHRFCEQAVWDSKRRMSYIRENQVDYMFHKTFQYSSWMQTTNHVYKRNLQTSQWYVQKERTMGQANYFLRLKMQSDAVCNGLAFANISFHESIVSRTHGDHRYLDAKNKLSYDGQRLFISLNYVDSTALMLSALDNVDKPVFLSETYNSSSWSKSRDAINLSETNIVDKIFLIPMHPERVTYNYESIENDADGTKIFESS